MKCEFEEKQFESALNSCLVSNHRFIYASGQCLENILGFDSALFTQNKQFWRIFHRVSPWHPRWFGFFPEGQELQREWWSALNKEIDYFPTIKFNLFIQYKRPTFHKIKTRTDEAHWNHWQQPFYKYKKTRHQQFALEQLEEQIKGTGLVVYASPAFYRYNELWPAIENDTLVERTNFVEVHAMRKHSKYSYISGGNEGFGLSEPEPIRGIPFLQRINELRQINIEPYSNKEKILGWGEAVDSAARLNKRIRLNYLKILAGMRDGIADSRLALAFSRLEIFCFLTNTNCLFGYEETQK